MIDEEVEEILNDIESSDKILIELNGEEKEDTGILNDLNDESDNIEINVEDDLNLGDEDLNKILENLNDLLEDTLSTQNTGTSEKINDIPNIEDFEEDDEEKVQNLRWVRRWWLIVIKNSSFNKII